jgi:hypothetical protein
VAIAAPFKPYNGIKIIFNDTVKKTRNRPKNKTAL